MIHALVSCSVSDLTKLIALTGYGQQSDVDLAIDAGFDSHLVKPLDIDELTKLMIR